MDRVCPIQCCESTSRNFKNLKTHLPTSQKKSQLTMDLMGFLKDMPEFEEGFILIIDKVGQNFVCATTSNLDSDTRVYV